jgi:hypothetical protein
MSYHRFNLLMDRSPGFGSTSCNYFALFRLGFPAAPVLHTLTSLHKRNSLARSSISTTSHSLIVLRLLVNIGFQVLFHSPPGVLFTFPSRYYSAIGHQVVFSLGEWSPLLPTGFLVSCGTLDPARFASASYTGLLPLSCGFPTIFYSLSLHFVAAPQPQHSVDCWFGLFPVRSPLLRESLLLSFPPVTKMFQFTGFPLHTYVFSMQ